MRQHDIQPLKTFTVDGMTYDSMADGRTVWRANNNEGRSESGPQVRADYFSYIREQERAIDFFNTHSDRFAYVISGGQCTRPINVLSFDTGYDPEPHELFQAMVDSQSRYVSQVYKHFQIEVGNNRVIVADMDNDGLLDHFSVNEFNRGGVAPIILDGDSFDPLISSMFEYSKEPRNCGEQRSGSEFGLLLMGVVVFSLICAI
jgi:hypothetical protein